MAMNASTSWTGIPRDFREQERLQLERQLFRNISFENEDDGGDNRRDPVINLRYDDEEEEGDSFSVEFPRNPQMLSHDYTAPDLSIRYPGTLTDHQHEEEEGETKSTIAHHAHGVTFRTGLRGRTSGGNRTRAGTPNGEYDPDRHFDALIRGTSEFSILADSPDNRSTSRSRSEFTKRARGLSKQIEHEKSRRAPLTASVMSNLYQPHEAAEPIQPTVTSSKPTPLTPKQYKPAEPVTIIPPFKNPNPYSSMTVPPPALGKTPTRVWPAFSKVQLPDVTGITTAIATPAKGDTSFKRFPSAKFPPPSTISAPTRQPSSSKPDTIKIVNANEEAGNTVTAAALDTLTKKLKDIERENATSRRRVTELELELETCKEDVKREKTRLEDLSRTVNTQGQQRRVANGISMRGNTRNGDVSLQDVERRYKESVEEKKALEALVQSLQAHLTSMSVKVQSNQDAISQLRTTREQDALQLREKCREIEYLRKDVESLQGDVERLRDVVETGLRERKASRGEHDHSIIVGERTEIHDVVQDDYAPEEEEEEEGYDNPLLTRPIRREPEVLSAVIEETEPSSRDSHHRTGSARSGSRRFVKDSEIERVRQEIEERRSQRSMSASVSSDKSGHSHSRSRSYAHGFNAATASARPSSPVVIATTRNQRQHQQQHTPPRPDSRAASDGEESLDRQPLDRGKQRAREERERVPSPTALPQIRGERLERLFRAAPEHDEQTCRVCHRRKRSASASHPPGSDELRWLPKACCPPSSSKDGKARGGAEAFASGDERYISEIASRRGLPPQTVLARVLRELEDDFTHYKSIYIELADQYKAMDAASDASKRRLLANHLREVIDVLEQKGDQISSLYDLLHFEDKPLSPTVSASKPGPSKRR